MTVLRYAEYKPSTHFEFNKLMLRAGPCQSIPLRLKYHSVWREMEFAATGVCW